MAKMPDYAHLVREYHGMVFSIACHALQNREAAEDVTQDVFLSLHGNLRRLESAQHVRNWLARVTANRCIDELRKGKYRRGPALDEIPEPASSGTRSDPFLDECLRGNVARLPAAARLMIILRFQEDMKLTEIAQALHIPVQTVKSRLHRALNLLRERMHQSMKPVCQERRV